LCYRSYTKILNEKLKSYSEKFKDEPKLASEKNDFLLIQPYFENIIGEKKRIYLRDTFPVYLDYEKALDEVRRPVLFSIYKAEVFLIHYLQQL
jgi:hypothetical protein